MKCALTLKPHGFNCLEVDGNDARAVYDAALHGRGIAAGGTPVLLSAEISDRLNALGAGPAPGTPEELAAHVRAEIIRVGRVVEGAKLKFD